MKHAPAVNDEAVRRRARYYPQCEVLFQLPVEALLDVARSDEFAVLAEEGRIVDREQHAHRRFVDGDRFERFGVLVIADRVADLEAFDAYQSADFAALHLVHLGFTQSLENHQVFDAGFDHRDAVALGQRNGHS